MDIRKPAVAGQFYDSNPEQCAAEVEHYINCRQVNAEIPDYVLAGVVPHAGWVFSGDLAGVVFSMIKKVNGNVDTFVIFGAAHRYMGGQAAVFDDGGWVTPMGQIEIDTDLAKKIIGTGCAVADKGSHKHEHSIEVQVPFIQHLFPEVKIVPILVPCSNSAVVLGEKVAEVIKGVDKRVVCIASTDLTHYGPRYGFYPHGVGEEAIKWAKDVNDKNFIDLALNMQASELLVSAEENASACGPGATAAVVAYAKGMGKQKGVLLGHTHSNEVLESKYNETSEESVGYAAIVY